MRRTDSSLVTSRLASPVACCCSILYHAVLMISLAYKMSNIMVLLCLVFSFKVVAVPGSAVNEMGVSFVNVAPAAGLAKVKMVYGDERKNRYLLETTGCGAAFIDYDNDGWLDIFLVNGTRLDLLPKEPTPTNHLYRNNGDGTFIDVTEKSGLVRTGWGQGVCIGDIDNDG